MKLLGRVLFLTLCVFSVYSLPSTLTAPKDHPTIDSVLHGVKDIFRSHFAGLNQSTTNSTNNNSTTNNTMTTEKCYAQFSDLFGFYSDGIVQLSEECHQSDFFYWLNTNLTAESAVVKINAISLRLRKSLRNCAWKRSAAEMFQCYVDTFETNAYDLYYVAALSRLTEDAFTGKPTELVITQSGCLDTLIMKGRVDLIVTLTLLEACLMSVPTK